MPRIVTKDEFAAAVKKHYKGNILLLEDYTRMARKYRVKCLKHDNVYLANGQSLWNGYTSCLLCNGQKPVMKEDLIKKLYELWGDGLDTSEVEDFSGVHTLVKVTCVKHGLTFRKSARELMKAALVVSTAARSVKGSLKANSSAVVKKNGVLSTIILRQTSVTVLKVSSESGVSNTIPISSRLLTTT